MEVPTSYSEWTCLLDKFGDGDDTVLETLNRGSFTVDAGTASRFYVRVNDVYKKRKQSWLDKFHRSFHLQNLKSEDEFEIALRNGKQNLSALGRFVTLSGLPDHLRTVLMKDFEDFVDEIKKSLKDNVSKTSRGREKMLMLLSTFGCSISDSTVADHQHHQQHIIGITPPTGRQIIF